MLEPVMNRRIIYLLDAAVAPAGGFAVIYKHVEILSEHGFNAFVGLARMPDIDFYKSRAPILIHNDNIIAQKGDIYVIPEPFQNYMEALKSAPCKKIMFCQNHYYLPFSGNYNLGFSEFSVDSVLISSQSIASYLGSVYGLKNLPLIPYSIDNKFFPSANKLRQIAYMPRKLPDEAKFIQASFKRLFKEFQDIPWVSIHGVSTDIAAKILSESAFFLSLSHRESFGLPPLEAMASGCLVAGFHGDGGREYMHRNNGWWADPGDWQACVNGLASAVRVFDERGAAFSKIQSEMAATVSRYQPEQMKHELLKFWTTEIQTHVRR